MSVGRTWWVGAAVVGALVLPGACGPKIVEVGDLSEAGASGETGEGGSGGTGATGGTGGTGNQPTPPPVCEFSWPPRGDEPFPTQERCTRAAGGPAGRSCPVGTGKSSTVEIGPAGGVVRLTGTASTLGVDVELTIPANALSESVEITVTETAVPTPGGFSDWSPLYYFSSSKPVELAFPADLRMPWNNSDGVGDPALSIYWSSEADSCELVPLDDNYVNAGFNQGSVSFLGWAIVGAALPSE
jgi:hypothetical protein